MKPGTLFYECQSGMNIEAVCVDTPSQTDGHGGRAHWRWNARNTQTGEPITYGLTEGYEHYGPRLYSQPQYGGMSDGKFVFPLMGGEAMDMDGSDPHGLRNPEALEAWATSLGTDGPAIPMKDWMAAAAELAAQAEEVFNLQFIQARKNEITGPLREVYEKPQVQTFSHGVDLAAEVVSTDPAGGDVTPGMIRQALRDRINSLSDADLMQAVNILDSAEVEKAQAKTLDDGREMAM